MRRFIESLTGKVVSHVVVLALVLPYLTLSMIGRAEAQIQVAPQLAVLEFANRKSPGTDFGRVAAEAVASEYSKTNAYEVLPQETVARGIQSLGLTPPVTETTNILRLGQQLGVSRIVSGDLVDYNVRNVSGGRQAMVSMRVIVTDVASGLPVNGAALVGQSTIRSGDASDETLIADAISSGAAQAVRQIQQRSLPTGTVLNTRAGAGAPTALVNQGARSGFKLGQDIVFTRQGLQVGNGRVSSVDPDQSEIVITKYTLGIQPGDRVTVLFTPPDIRPGISSTGTAQVGRSGGGGISSALVTSLLLVGLLALLVTGKGGGSQEATGSFTAEPTVVAGNGNAEVKLSWTAGLFAGANRNYVAWQIWRSDVVDTPVAVLNDAGARTFYDTTAGGRTFTWTNLNGQIGGTQCDFTIDDINDQDVTGVAGVTPGFPYNYQLQLLYRITQADLNNGDTGNGGGGGGGGGGTGGSNIHKPIPNRTARTQQTRQESWCYFLSGKSSAGPATPINRPVLGSPRTGTPVPPDNGVLTFQVTSPWANQPNANVEPEYILQFSTSLNFSSPFTASTWTSATVPTVSLQFDVNSADVPSAIRSGNFYWRIGVRNGFDRPGPVPDPLTHQRYIFSIPNLLRRETTPGVVRGKIHHK